MMIFKILLVAAIIFLIYAIPSSLIAFAIKKKINKKLSKGWCFFICAVSWIISCTIEILLLGVHQPSIIDMCIRFSGLSLVFSILYDKNIPSIFDSEKEIKEKTNKINNTDA